MTRMHRSHDDPETDTAGIETRVASSVDKCPREVSEGRSDRFHPRADVKSSMPAHTTSSARTQEWELLVDLSEYKNGETRILKMKAAIPESFGWKRQAALRHGLNKTQSARSICGLVLLVTPHPFCPFCLRLDVACPHGLVDSNARALLALESQIPGSTLVAVYPGLFDSSPHRSLVLGNWWKEQITAFRQVLDLMKVIVVPSIKRLTRPMTNRFDEVLQIQGHSSDRDEEEGYMSSNGDRDRNHCRLRTGVVLLNLHTLDVMLAVNLAIYPVRSDKFSSNVTMN
ncbi:hypothetical protein BDN72DRAFT_863827 [Pluteus cervinus]|uniref:Uncharacterized protein n=1 Tax=Pluteus cervinus TaxID=181527 RepID=A0ACD3A6W7_9AGAR|nr:hypothetical protein BDN72DRAFT_863827 [Pluteus cervinus]